MKNILKYTLISLLFLGLIMISCSSDESDDPKEDPTTGDCLDFNDLESYYDNITYLEFLDDNNGWIIGAKQSDWGKKILFNTTDGGENWTITNNNLDIHSQNGIPHGESIYFIDETDGFMSTYTSSDITKLKIAYTTDKGVAWTNFDNPFVNVTTKWDGSFASNDTSTVFFGHSNFDSYIIVVDNASKIITYSGTYNDVIVNESVAKGVHFSNNGTITALVTGGAPGTIDGNYKIAQTTDYGATWSITYDIENSSYLTTAHWPNDDVGYYVMETSGDYEDAYKTTDGGATWVQTTTPKDFRMIRFADSDNGIGVSNFDFFYTSDGGTTWVDLGVCKNSEGQQMGGYDEVISYPSVNNGWVAGSKYDEDFTNSNNGLYNFKGE